MIRTIPLTFHAYLLSFHFILVGTRASKALLPIALPSRMVTLVDTAPLVPVYPRYTVTARNKPLCPHTDLSRCLSRPRFPAQLIAIRLVSPELLTRPGRVRSKTTGSMLAMLLAV